MELDVIIGIVDKFFDYENIRIFESIFERNFLAAKDDENYFIKITSYC